MFVKMNYVNQDASETIFFRPGSVITPYHLYGAARWISQRFGISDKTAFTYLLDLSKSDYAKYKRLLSQYLLNATRKYKRFRWKQPREYTTGHDEEPAVHYINGKFVKIYMPYHYKITLKHNGYGYRY